jgi:3-(3-hydroxy-phenyl)propionate hydroxylase
MRAFQQLGLAGRVLPHTAIFDRSIYYGLDGRIIKKLTTAAPPYALGWCPNYLFSQPAVDQLLRDSAKEHASVEVRLGSDVTDVAQDADAVALTVRSPQGSAESIRARYVVACDGGSSPMRRRLGIGFDDLDFDEPWLVVDAIVDEAHLPSLPQTNVQYCEPSRPSTHVIGPGRHRRWELMLLPGETPEEMNQEAQIWKVLARWISPDNAKLWRSSTYRFHALVAKQWHQGRIIIAGDAAHMTPPFLGQGMCQGLRDTTNLAWKLDLILRGGAPAEPLLTSYKDERAPHVRGTTQVAKELGRIICELDPSKAAMRDAELLADPGGIERVRQSLIPDLTGGILSRRDRGKAVGSIFPQPRVRHEGHEKLLDDMTSSGFRLVSRGLDVSALVGDPRVERLGMKLATVAPNAPSGVIAVDECDHVLRDWLDRHEAAVVLVRPDHYVFGTGSTAADASALVGELSEMLFARS